MIVDIDDNFQLTGGDDPSLAEVGWEIFKDYWKPWRPREETGPGGNGARSSRAVLAARRRPQEEAESGESAAILTYACSDCGTVANGIESIKKTFGIEGPSQILIEYLEAEKYDLLPSKCADAGAAAPGKTAGRGPCKGCFDFGHVRRRAEEAGK